jgi:hypothetical protein
VSDTIKTMIDRLTERQHHEFAVACARRVQHLMRDPRSVAALDTRERWLRGEATDEEMNAARDAAWDAGAEAWDAEAEAWAAARAAERAAVSAARDARDAAWYAAAARDAARDAWYAAWAARDAAGHSALAARDAAGYAADEEDAAFAAVEASERKWQSEELKRMLVEVKP